MKAGVVIAGGLVTAAALTAWIMTMNRAKNELNPMIKVNLHKISLSGITLRVDILVKNPTKAVLKFVFPFITLLYNGTVIGSSQSVSKDVIVPAYGQTNIDGIMVDIPFNTLLTSLPGVYKAFINKQPISLQARTVSTIHMPLWDQPWERVDTINLMSGNHANG